MSVIRDNVIPLYINSKDRTDVSDSTTDFRIKIRKSLRNIETLNVSNVVIPRNDSVININNNEFSGSVSIDGALTPFSITITNGDYDPVALALECETAMNASSISSVFGFIWAFTYNPTTKRIDIELTYPDGAIISSWGIVYSYTPLLDVVGIGSGSTSGQSFLTGLADVLVIPTPRAPVLVRALAYNVTSRSLTDAINTSYVQSLSKIFNIDTSNNNLVINSQLTLSGLVFDTPLPDDASLSSSIKQGVSVDMSTSGDIIVVGTLGFGASVFTRTTTGGFWLERGNLLFGSGEIGSSEQGSAVSISGDGTTIAIGGYADDSSIGAVWIFTRTGNIWTEQTKILPIGHVGAPEFGKSVSLSSSGDTIAIGGPLDDSSEGAVWVFVRTSGVWSIQGTKNVGAGNTLPAEQGSSVDISDDGNTIAFGGVLDVAGAGSTWVFLRVAGVWSQQGAKLTDVAGSDQGTSVALSSNGDTLVVGAPGGGITGETRVYLRTAGVWAQQGPTLIGSPADASKQGTYVTISDDGNTMLTASPFSGSGNNNSIWVFNRTGVTWSETQRIDDADDTYNGGLAINGAGQFLSYGSSGKLPTGSAIVYELDVSQWQRVNQVLASSNFPSSSMFGYAVSVSRDGNYLAIGGPDDEGSNPGATWIYKRNGSEWVQVAPKLVANVGFPVGDREGAAVALNADGSVVVVGAPSGPLGFGIGWANVWTRSGDTWTLNGVTLDTGGPGASRNATAVAISDSGDTILVSRHRDTASTGAVVVYESNGTDWIQQGPKLVSSDFVGAAEQGIALDISADGNTLAFGGPEDDGGIGAMWIFTRTAGVWTQAEPKFIGTGAIGLAKQGSAISISKDGLTVAVGAPDDDGGIGATWIFKSVLGVWDSGTKLVGTGAIGLSAQGTSISLNEDGTKLAVGAPVDDAVGATWYFTYSDGAWDAGTKYVATPGESLAFGSSVSMVGDGLEYVVGDPTITSDEGAVWTVVGGTKTGSVGQFTFAIPEKAYTIYEIVDTFNEFLNQGKLAQFAMSFDGVETGTLNSILPAGVTQNVFFTDDTSTFASVVWPVKELLESQVSAVIDFTINNNVIKTIVNHDDNNDNVLVDGRESLIFRKYKPGYTIDVSTEIDIQLRDERDRIVDLNGADWIITVFATILS